METSPLSADPPLSIEPVAGWRVWRLHRRAGVLTLVSVMRPDAWPPKEVMEAACMVHRGAAAPNHACSCGLYAASSPEDLALSGVFRPETCVMGAVAMWGRVVEHSRGARSRFGYPARLRLVCGPCLAAGAGAVDPTAVLGTGGELNAVCRRHLDGLQGPTTPAEEVQAELLATYSVEVMPIERFRRNGRRAFGPPRPTWAQALLRLALVIGTVLRLLVGGLFMLWAFSGMIILGLAIVVGVVQTGIHALGFGPESPTPTAVAAPPRPLVVPPADDLPARGTPPPRPPPFAFVCGLDEGRQVHLIPCDVPADLIGFAERTMPQGPAKDCLDDWDAYSRGPHYWICWTDLRVSSPVRPWSRAPNPWSIPVRQGGAIHGYR